MSDPTRFDQLLEATIQHVEDLKTRGVRYIPLPPRDRRAGPQSRRRMVRQDEVAEVLPKGGREAPEHGDSVGIHGSGADPVLEVEASQEPSPSLQTALSAPAASDPESSSILLEPGLFDELSAPGVAQAPAPNLTPEAKVQAMAELRERALVCAKCPNLARTRKNVVFGVGHVDAALMFVGEAPGADEDSQGEPFVGRAGELLTKIIQTMGLSRGEVYIANILKCRPDTPNQISGNRKPTAEEMKTCLPYLHAQIDLIQPKVLVALGATAVEGLLGRTVGITKLRGHWQTYRATPLMPTYHPAYLLRNQAVSEKRKVWEDMLQVMERLGMAVSAKQRNYFHKSG